MKEPIHGLHRTANPSYPILAVHSASAFSFIPGSGTEARHAQSSDKTSTEVLASQIIFSSPEHTRCLILDVTGHWTLVAIENGKAEKQKEGQLTEDKRVLRFASISKDGVITATGTFPRLSLGLTDDQIPTTRSSRNNSTTPSRPRSLPSYIPLPHQSHYPSPRSVNLSSSFPLSTPRHRFCYQ